MDNQKLGEKKKELDESLKQTVKAIVKATFEAIDSLEEEKNLLQNKIKILKHDLFDLKDGRLDRVLERQEIDPIAKATSTLIVKKKEGQQSVSPWYVEYLVSYKIDDIFVDTALSLNNSIIKLNASGSYKLSNDTIKYL